MGPSLNQNKCTSVLLGGQPVSKTGEGGPTPRACANACPAPESFDTANQVKTSGKVASTPKKADVARLRKAPVL